jgi:PiT family inorganic phosphate transporter
MTFVVLFALLLALAVDYVNGFHDAANSIATVVSTRVLTPKQAVAWAAFFNFIAAFGFGVHVANTIGKGIIAPGIVTEYVILAGLVGTITWNLITWYYGIPSSSSHALIGGFIGAAITKDGGDVLMWSGLSKILFFIVLSPLIGMLLGFTFMVIMYWIFRNFSP